jgi:hypothetical protein
MKKLSPTKRNRDPLSITANEERYWPETLKKSCYLSLNGCMSIAPLLSSTKRSAKLKACLAGKKSAYMRKSCYLNFDKDVCVRIQDALIYFEENAARF